MPENTVAAIEVSGLTKRFGSVLALDNVSFSIESGELFFLLGPSGCGKTTLLRILAGLETPDAGVVRFNGRDISSLPPHERGCPMVFQNYALWPHLSVKENVAFGLVERRVPRSEMELRIAEALKRTGLGGLESRMPGQLSGGQQQRVVLARALVLNPGVVLLDEPLSNLDAKLRAEMREEIERLHAETDITFVYVTHDQTEALTLADRMAVMNAGRLSALGAPRDLYHRPPNVFCADFLGEANVVPGRVSGSEGDGMRVETAFGVWKGVTPAGSGAPAGAAVRCVIRPENVHCPPAPGENVLQGEVVGTRMNGSTMTVHLEGAGMRLKATILNRYSTRFQRGARMEWGMAPEDTLIFREAGSQ